ncbi:hypothetical protein OF846_004252 [Rhodotorula toruloides]|nr:hypothetical protein OF846_004252 [Rhodotorula toruloides]
MDQQKAFGRITKRVHIEKAVLTYRLAARELGVSVKDAKALLAAYHASDAAKEREIKAVYLLSGYLKKEETDGAAKGQDGEDKMDVDGEDGTQATQQTQADGTESVRVKTMALVQEDELEAKRSLFTDDPAPSSHIYALSPAHLTSLSLLSTTSLSLIPPSVRETKWKASPDDIPAYGGIVHPDGERKRKPGQGARKSAAMPAAPKAGPSKDKAAVKKQAEPPAKPAKGKGKAKEEPAKGKKKDEPKARPIGQLGGLFARKFEDKKGKKKANSSDEEDDDESAEEESEEDVKPKKKGSVVPAKRKSTSPAVSRKKPDPPAAKSKAVKQEADIVMDDDDDDWAMDEEALLEAERAAEKQAASKKTDAATNGGGGKKAPALSRTSSSSSSTPQPKVGGTNAKNKSAAPAQQKGIGSFFKKN